MKKNFVSLLFTSFLLLSCNGNLTVYGTYEFQLGKEGEKHAGAFLELTKETVQGDKKDENGNVIIGEDGKPVQEDKGKKFNLSISADMGLDESIIDNVPTGEKESETSDEKSELKFSGYFNIEGDKYRISRHKRDLKFAIDLDLGGNTDPEEPVDPEPNQGRSFISKDETPTDDPTPTEGEGDEEGGDTPSIDPETVEQYITEDIIQSVVYSTITSNEINMEFPVSLTDLAIQLFWYGYDFSLDTLEVIERDKIGDIPCGKPGEHPSEEQIKAINDTTEWKESFIRTITNDSTIMTTLYAIAPKFINYIDVIDNFRDFNTVKITLKKA